ncbi:hypothetical protein pdam_00018010 [Pocillopora damicornis]|uniref:Uncharacterized protein n=1 Tax=Pocillopora damicornis TaxID=46731 RepID=A0A3M6TFB5_POCDA|nr:hypothetical protein pdam_00018010 [Pocillopora damicornis]
MLLPTNELAKMTEINVLFAQDTAPGQCIMARKPESFAVCPQNFINFQRKLRPHKSQQIAVNGLFQRLVAGYWK